jgi:hypothetical protein
VGSSHLAAGAVGTGQIAAAAVGSTQLADAAVGMRELSTPNGEASDSNETPLAGNTTYLFSSSTGSTFTPSASGSCMVTVQANLRADSGIYPAAAEGAILKIARRTSQGAVDQVGAGSGYFPLHHNDRTSATAAGIVPVTANTTYSFGCEITAEGDWLFNVASCTVVWMCQ